MYDKRRMACDLLVSQDDEGDIIVEIPILFGTKRVVIAGDEKDNSWKEEFPCYFDKRILTLKFLKSLIKGN